MKNLNSICLILAGSVILFSTCKKDSTTTGCNLIKAKLVGANSTDTMTTNYSYNTNGKLIKVDMGLGNYTSYLYSGSTLTKSTYVNNAISSTDVFTLNSSGFADSAINKNASSTTISKTQYEYDENGFLTTKTVTKADDNTDVTFTTYSYDDNGNRTSTYTEHNIGSNGYTANWQYDYVYYTDKVNKNPSTLAYEGKQSTNLAKSTTYSYNGTVALSITYAYELNSDGYISKQTTVSGGEITYIFAEYNCN